MPCIKNSNLLLKKKTNSCLFLPLSLSLSPSLSLSLSLSLCLCVSFSPPLSFSKPLSSSLSPRLSHPLLSPTLSLVSLSPLPLSLFLSLAPISFHLSPSLPPPLRLHLFHFPLALSLPGFPTVHFCFSSFVPPIINLFALLMIKI